MIDQGMRQDDEHRHLDHVQHEDAEIEAQQVGVENTWRSGSFSWPCGGGAGGTALSSSTMAARASTPVMMNRPPMPIQP
jgi:hypothetical protein